MREGSPTFHRTVSIFSPFGRSVNHEKADPQITEKTTCRLRDFMHRNKMLLKMFHAEHSDPPEKAGRRSRARTASSEKRNIYGR
jgi:hypothetical protein